MSRSASPWRMIYRSRPVGRIRKVMYSSRRAQATRLDVAEHRPVVGNDAQKRGHALGMRPPGHGLQVEGGEHPANDGHVPQDVGMVGAERELDAVVGLAEEAGGARRRRVAAPVVPRTDRFERRAQGVGNERAGTSVGGRVEEAIGGGEAFRSPVAHAQARVERVVRVRKLAAQCQLVGVALVLGAVSESPGAARAAGAARPDVAGSPPRAAWSGGGSAAVVAAGLWLAAGFGGSGGHRGGGGAGRGKSGAGG